jgi:hypothetical protein
MFDIAIPPFALVLTNTKGGEAMLDIELPNPTQSGGGVMSIITHTLPHHRTPHCQHFLQSQNPCGFGGGCGKGILPIPMQVARQRAVSIVGSWGWERAREMPCITPSPFVLVYTNGEGAMHVIALPFLHPCGPAVDVSHCLASPNTNGGGAMSGITLPFLHRAIALPFPHHIFI